MSGGSNWSAGSNMQFYKYVYAWGQFYVLMCMIEKSLLISKQLGLSMILDSMARPIRIICIYRIGNTDIEMWCHEIAWPTYVFDSMAISTYIWCACITNNYIIIHSSSPPPKKKKKKIDKKKKKNEVAWPICLILDIKARPIHMIYYLCRGVMQ